jgi:hypothetical protein
VSEERNLRKLAEERRTQQEAGERLLKGILETKDGSRIHPSPDSKKFAVMPRSVDAHLKWVQLLEGAFANAYFVAQYSFEAFERMVTIILNMIPEEDTDETFREEVSKATIITRIPTGKYGGFGGGTYEIVETVKEYDPLAIHRAIVNLLRRRGLTITPRLWEEKPTEMYWAREGENAPVEHIVDAKTEDDKHEEET